MGSEGGSKEQARKLILGLDVGSVSIDSMVLDNDGGILHAGYTRTKGRPLNVALQVLEEIFARYPREDFLGLALTGTGASRLAPLVDGAVVNEIVALARGVSVKSPLARTIIDMGGEDAKMILVSPDGNGGLVIEDFAMNTMCAAGTGSFLDQQSHRLQLTIEEFSKIALKSQSPPRLAGRCSVFAKTDMIHLQQDATPDYDIVAGLCYAMARNLKSNIAKGKTAVPPVVFCGGVAANKGVHRALKDVLEIEADQLIVPEHFACLGALGAALTARELGSLKPVPALEALRQRAGKRPGRPNACPR